MTLTVGERAPAFSLPGTGGRPYALADYAGQPVVLVFYPGDNTPVCTKQLNAYTAVKAIRWDGAWCRKDISDKALWKTC